MHLSAVTVCDMNIWPDSCSQHVGGMIYTSHMVGREGERERERERERGGGEGVCFYFIKDTTLVH